MNENNIKYISSYATCPMASCNRSNTCVRYANYLKAISESDTYELINFPHLGIDSTTCPYHLVAEKQCWARGFNRLYNTIPAGNARGFYMRTPYTPRRYYKAKNGEILIEPEMQQKLLAIFQRNGADVSVGFDDYEEKEIWVEK